MGSLGRGSPPAESLCCVVQQDPLLSTRSIQDGKVSRHDWRIVEWDVRHKKTHKEMDQSIYSKHVCRDGCKPRPVFWGFISSSISFNTALSWLSIGDIPFANTSSMALSWCLGTIHYMTLFAPIRCLSHNQLHLQLGDHRVIRVSGCHFHKRLIKIQLVIVQLLWLLSTLS